MTFMQIKHQWTGAVLFKGDFDTMRLCVEAARNSDAIEFCRKVGWPARIVGGSLPGAGYCFVQKEG